MKKKYSGQGTDSKEHRIFLCIILLLSAYHLFPHSYAAKLYTIEDGLANATILAITQDVDGVMWFGTYKGVSSYDGSNWRNYSEEHGLAVSRYYHLLPAPGGVMAFSGTLRDGFHHFDGRRWRNRPGPFREGKPAGRGIIQAVAQCRAGGKHLAGVATRNCGFFYHDGANWRHLPLEEQAVTGKEAGNGTAVPVPLYGAVGMGDSFYLASAAGLIQLDMSSPDKVRVHRRDLKAPAPSVFSIAIENPHADLSPEPHIPVIWLTGHKWIGTLRGDTFQVHYRGDFPGFNDFFKYSNVTSCPDRYNGLWFGNEGALVHLNSEGGVFRIMERGLPYTPGINVLFKDREYILWLGTTRGLQKITSFYFENYRRGNGLFDNEVSAVSELPDGTMVLGHNRGLTFLDGDETETVKFSDLPPEVEKDSRVLDLCRDPEGNVWGAVTFRGIFRVSPARKFTWYKNFSSSTSKGLRYYSSVLTDIRGRILATENNRVFRFQGNRFVPLEVTGGISDDNIRRLFQGPGDSVYIACGGSGLFRLRGNTIEHVLPMYSRKDNNSIYAFFPRRDGKLLLGTTLGLFVLNPESLEYHRFKQGDFQIRQPVYFILSAPDSSLWFGLDNGVIRWDGHTFRHYTAHDGLAGFETNRAAGYVDKRGRIWIGTEGGVSRYNRKRDNPPLIPPLLELLQFKASGNELPLYDDVTLPYDRNDLTFQFRGISFIDEKAIRYRFKLEGYDTGWTRDYRSLDNQMRYTSIPPGEYRFHLQAVNRVGIPSAMVSSGRITVRNPFWRSPWFYLLLFLASMAFIFIFVNYLIHKRYSGLLESEVDERTRELQRSRKDLENIFDHAHDSIVIFRPHDEVVLEVNRRACEMYGFTREQLIGMSIQELSHDVPRGQRKITEVLDDKTFVNFETVQYHRDGTPINLEINASLIDFQGRKAILSLNRDIAERKRTEKILKQSLEQKEVLLREIHHRVKNHLQIISSLLELQAESEKNPDILRMLHSNTSRIRSIALIHENLYRHDTLDLVDMGDYLHNLLAFSWSCHREHSVSATPDLTVDDVSLHIDIAIPLGLIITELLSNALKYAYRGTPKGTIRLKLDKIEETHVHLEFSDHGPGLPPEINLKKPSSLGLQLVNILVGQLKGTLTYEGAGGAVFRLTVPLYPHKNGRAKRTTKNMK